MYFKLTDIGDNAKLITWIKPSEILVVTSSLTSYIWIACPKSLLAGIEPILIPGGFVAGKGCRSLSISPSVTLRPKALEWRILSKMTVDDSAANFHPKFPVRVGSCHSLTVHRVKASFYALLCYSELYNWRISLHGPLKWFSIDKVHAGNWLALHF